MKSIVKKSKFQTKNVKTSFTGGNITKYAGLSPIMKYLNKQKLGKQLNKLFPTSKHNATKFSIVQIIMTVILASLSGINRISRISNFSSDPLVMALIGLKKRINPSAISKCFKCMSEKGARLLQEFSLNNTKEFILKSKIEYITIDCDSTVFTVFGHQEGAEKGYNPHKKGAKSYHPLMAFVSEFKLVLNSWFRSGSAYTSNGICEFIKQSATAIGQNMKSVLFRADSGFFNGELFDLLEFLSWNYLVKVKLKNLDNLLKAQNWIVTQENANISICEFDYKGKNWKKMRKLSAIRVVVAWKQEVFFGKSESTPIYEYACYCSDLELTATELYKLYAQRSTSETWIEQVKSQLMAGKTLTDSFWANDILWQLNVMAYNYSVIMRFKIKRFWREEHTTFKEWFINLPAKFISSGRGLVLKIYENYYYKRQWLELEKNLI